MEREKEVLPPELWAEIFHFLPQVSFACSMRLVCEEWKKTIDAESFWERKVKEDFLGEEIDPAPTVTWKERYQELSHQWTWRSTEFVEVRNRGRTAAATENHVRYKVALLSEQSILVTNAPDSQPRRRFYYWEIHLEEVANFIERAGKD